MELVRRNKYIIFMSIFVVLADTWKCIFVYKPMWDTAIKLGAKISRANVKVEKVFHLWSLDEYDRYIIKINSIVLFGTEKVDVAVNSASEVPLFNAVISIWLHLGQTK